MSETTESRHKLPPETKDQTIRRLSKTVLRAAQNKKKEIFNAATTRNADRITEMSKEKPIFFENDPTAEQRISLDDDISILLPDGFFEDPTGWVESQPNIERGYHSEFAEDQHLPKGENIEELWNQPYDVSKVKIITLSDGRMVISKRVEKDQLTEITRARKAYDVGIPTPKVLGEVNDKGNMYVWYEYLPAKNLDSLYQNREVTHLLYYSCPSSCVTSESFNDLTDDVFDMLTEESRNNLYSLWLEYKDNISRCSAAHALVSICQDCFRGDDQEKLLMKKQILIKDETVLQEILYALGYNSIESFIDSIKRMRFTMDVQEKLVQEHQELLTNASADTVSRLGFRRATSTLEIFANCLKRTAVSDVDKRQEETGGYQLLQYQILFEDVILLKGSEKADKKVERFKDKWDRMVQDEFFGFNIEDENNRLKEFCDERGAEHKDYNSRNILVRWDFDNNRPIKPKPGEPPLYLVDWEEKESSEEAGDVENQ